MSEEIKTLHQATQDYIEHVLFLCDGNVSEAAKALRIERRTIYRRFDVDQVRKRIQESKALSTPA